MSNFSPAVDDYIDKSAEFARPILKKIRKLFHQACPEIEEKLKWAVPSFEYKGMLGGMAAFRHHVILGFWKSRLLVDRYPFLKEDDTDRHAARLTKLSDLPPDKVVLACIRDAIALNERVVKVPASKKAPKARLKVPDYFRSALEKNPKARPTFQAFSPSHQREYLEWLIDAKQETTRQQRLATALEWLAEGKPRNWKYMRKK